MLTNKFAALISLAGIVIASSSALAADMPAPKQRAADMPGASPELAATCPEHLEHPRCPTRRDSEIRMLQP
jgi:hypothetical protein